MYVNHVNLHRIFLRSHFRLLIGQYVTVHGDVVSHVNVSAARPEDGGKYECLAQNRAGKVKHGARLNIYGEAGRV